MMAKMRYSVKTMTDEKHIQIHLIHHLEILHRLVITLLN